LGATVAWLFARRVLGHPQPFFAPIAAAVSLSVSQVQRSQRALQLMIGVTLGIGIGEGLQAAFGDGALVIGLAVLVSVTAWLLVEWRFIGQGMLFVNQMMVSAILVIALHRSGTGSERIIDALVGGVVAIVVGTLLFPAAPLPLLDAAVRRLLVTLAGTLGEAAAFTQRGVAPGQTWALEMGQSIHECVADLAGARGTARRVARVAPRRWSQRGAVSEAERRAAHLDLLASSTLSVLRAYLAALDQDEQLPRALADAIRELADAFELAADAADANAAEVHSRAERARELAASLGEQAGPQAHVCAVLIRACARDLESVLADASGPG
jgi:uncharacterized membrane protein YgaE (UPF0421/DUF939 family)